MDALSDYRYLKNRGYPHKAALAIIGDRYRLSKDQRNCLFRGVVDAEACHNTRNKILFADSLASKVLGIDWFNVLITIESYLKGFPIFLSDDGIVRDSAGVHSSYKVTEITRHAIQEIFSSLDLLKLNRIEIFIDAPISHSGEIAQMIRDKSTKDLRTKTQIEVVPSADFPLKNFHGIVASSDTIIIEHADHVFDLASHVIYRSFNCLPPDLETLAGK
jgi:hypothetical protein